MSRPVQFSSVGQSCLTLCNPWTAACRAFLSFTNSRSLLKLISIKSVMPSNHSSSVVPFSSCPQSLSQHQGLFQRVRSSIRWPKYWSYSFSISPSNEYSGLISFRCPPGSSTKRGAASYLSQEDREDVRSVVLAFTRGFSRALSHHPVPLAAARLRLEPLLCTQSL